jgi:hypothetical protein
MPGRKPKLTQTGRARQSTANWSEALCAYACIGDTKDTQVIVPKGLRRAPQFRSDRQLAIVLDVHSAHLTESKNHWFTKLNPDRCRP